MKNRFIPLLLISSLLVLWKIDVFWLINTDRIKTFEAWKDWLWLWVESVSESVLNEAKTEEATNKANQIDSTTKSSAYDDIDKYSDNKHVFSGDIQFGENWYYLEICNTEWSKRSLISDIKSNPVSCVLTNENNVVAWTIKKLIDPWNCWIVSLVWLETIDGELNLRCEWRSNWIIGNYYSIWDPYLAKKFFWKWLSSKKVWYTDSRLAFNKKGELIEQYTNPINQLRQQLESVSWIIKTQPTETGKHKDKTNEILLFSKWDIIWNYLEYKLSKIYPWKKIIQRDLIPNNWLYELIVSYKIGTCANTIWLCPFPQNYSFNENLKSWIEWERNHVFPPEVFLWDSIYDEIDAFILVNE